MSTTKNTRAPQRSRRHEPNSATPACRTAWCRRARRRRTAASASLALRRPATRAPVGCPLSPALYLPTTRDRMGVGGVGGEGGQPADGDAAGVGVVVKPACHHEALGFAQSAGEGGVCGVGCPVGAWDVSACAGDSGAVYGDGVGLVWGAVGEGLLACVWVRVVWC